jgi:hypothetical protein
MSGYLFDPMAVPGPMGMIGRGNRQLLTEENAGLIQQNEELRKQIALMSQTVALTHANVRQVAGDRLSSAASRFALDKARATQGKFSAPLYYRACERSKCVADRSLLKGRSRDTSPAASTTASTCGFINEVDESNDSASSVDQDEVHRTTMMLRNVPSEYTRADLLGLIDQKGFNGLYDLFYMPVDFQTELNHGYAFINFGKRETADRFLEEFNGFNDWSAPSDRICEVTWSDQSQGLDENIERYRNSPMMHESVEDRFKPVFFQNGQRVPFPGPTKKIRAPRRKKA